jgi:hypothetical protein
MFWQQNTKDRLSEPPMMHFWSDLKPRAVNRSVQCPTYGEGDVLMLMSVFSVFEEVAGDGFTTVVLVSFFSAGGFVTLVSFCSHAGSKNRPQSRKRYFLIPMNRIFQGTQPSLFLTRVFNHTENFKTNSDQNWAVRQTRKESLQQLCATNIIPRKIPNV